MQIAVLLALVAVVSPVGAEESDCTKWSIKDLSPGITLEELLATGIEFEHKPYKNFGKLGYRRYVWQAQDRPEKIDVQVNMNVEPPRLIGVMTTIPYAQVEPKAFFHDLVDRWGQPDNVSGQGAFALYNWDDAECDVNVRVSIMNQYHQVGAWVAISSIGGIDELARREMEERRATGAPSEHDPAAAMRPVPDTPSDGGDRD